MRSAAHPACIFWTCTPPFELVWHFDAQRPTRGRGRPNPPQVRLWEFTQGTLIGSRAIGKVSAAQILMLPALVCTRAVGTGFGWLRWAAGLGRFSRRIDMMYRRLVMMRRRVLTMHWRIGMTHGRIGMVNRRIGMLLDNRDVRGLRALGRAAVVGGPRSLRGWCC